MHDGGNIRQNIFFLADVVVEKVEPAEKPEVKLSKSAEKRRNFILIFSCILDYFLSFHIYIIIYLLKINKNNYYIYFKIFKNYLNLYIIRFII